MANSDYFRDLILQRTIMDQAVVPQVFISLHDADPLETGAAEIGGRGYERQEVLLERIGTGLAANQAAIEFTNLPRARITHFGLWDARDGGDFLSGGAVLQPQTALEGYSMRWRDGELVLRFG